VAAEYAFAVADKFETVVLTAGPAVALFVVCRKVPEEELS